MAGTLKVGGVTLATESSGTVNLSSNTGLGSVTISSGTVFPSGHVIQVVQSSYTTHWEQVMNGTTPEYINNGVEDLNVTITPASSSNKVFLTFSFGAHAAHNTSSGVGLACAIDRNGTLIGINTGSDTAVPKVSFILHTLNMDYDGKGTSYTYLDSPSTTSACVYKIKCTAHSNANWTTRWNRTQTTTTASSGYGGVCVTNFTAMEVQG